RLDAETASMIWSTFVRNQPQTTREQKVAKLYSTMLIYLRTEIAFLSYMTSVHFKNFFRDKDFSSKSIFNDFLDYASQLKDFWRDIKNGNGYLQDFLAEAIEKNLPTNYGDEYEAFRTQSIAMSGIEESINFVSVRPHMLMLSYFLGKFEGEFERFVWWLNSYVTIDLSGLILSLLNGKIEDLWFDYGVPSSGINSYEVFHTFDYWIRSDVLSNYSKVSQTIDGVETSIVSEDTFFTFLVEKYLNSETSDLETMLSSFNKQTEETVAQFHDRCLNPETAQYIGTDDLQKRVFFFRENYINNFTTPNRKGVLTDRLKKLRTEFQLKMKKVDTFLNLLTHYDQNPPVRLDQLTTQESKDREETRRANIRISIQKLEEKKAQLITMRNTALANGY
ncbi:MAG: hypothetical protein AAF202_12705, partial [Pseudomonadota bacterium]